MKKSHPISSGWFGHAVLILVLAMIAVLFAGCGIRLESVPVSVQSPEGPVSVVLRDGERRKPADELVIAASDTAGYAVSFRAEQTAAPLEVLQIDLSGDPRGGQVAFERDGRLHTVRLNDVFRVDDTGWNRLRTQGVQKIRVNVPLPEWFDVGGVIPKGTAVTFSTDKLGREFRVDALAFTNLVSLGSPVPKLPDSAFIGLETASTGNPGRIFVFDYRMPVDLVGSVWTIGGIGSAGVLIEYAYPDDQFQDYRDRPFAVLETENAALRWNLRPGKSSTVVRPRLWEETGGNGGAARLAGVPVNYLRLTPPGTARSGVADTAASGVADDQGRFVLLRVEPVGSWTDQLTPIPVELSEFSRYPQSEWRNDEFEVFSWTLYPDILWIDSRDYVVQSRFFKRLAFFVEKQGYIGSLLTDAEMAGQHGYNAHNYSPGGLADFYNAVETASFPINRYEQYLRDIAEIRGIILRDASGLWRGGGGGVLGVSRESLPAHRRLLVVHESMHAVLYEEDQFHQGVADYWRQTLTERERRYWQDMFAWMHYSPDDEYLMYNEFQAYLLQQPQRAVRWYFRTRMADRVRSSLGRYEPVDAFLQDHPTTFVDSADAINSLLFQTTGMVGGDPFCLVPLSD
jgi:hypothetical protein